MQEIKVNGSSNIRRIKYENTTLVIEFTSNGIYSYSDVPQEVFNEFAESPSKGSFFAANIKGKYESTKL